MQGSHWLARHANVLQAIGAARTGADYAKALLFVEGMLVEQQALKPQWEAHMQAAWRDGLESCTESRQAIMYLASLQVKARQSLLNKTPHAQALGQLCIVVCMLLS